MNIKQILYNIEENKFFKAIDKGADKIYLSLLFVCWVCALPILLFLGLVERIIKKAIV